MPDTPLLIIDSTQDDSMVFSFFEAGVQDYLIKNEINAHALARAIKYAIMRHQLRFNQIGFRSSVQLEIATILAESNNMHHAASDILKILCTTLHFMEGEIWVLEPKEKIFRNAASWRQPEASTELSQLSYEITFQLREGLPGLVYSDKKPYWSNNLAKDTIPVRNKILARLGYNCGFGFPIMYKGSVFGVILLFGHHVKKPNQRVLKMVDMIGRQLGNFFKRRRREVDLLELVQHDALTGLANRRYAENFLQYSLCEAKQTKASVAFLYIDLDFFKIINDTKGHAVGDVILQEVANRLRASTRDIDVSARLGGDEFAVIMVGLSGESQISDIAKKILKAIKMPYKLGNSTYHLSASIGISVYPQDGDNVSELIKIADEAMYRVKKSGKNNYQYRLRGSAS